MSKACPKCEAEYNGRPAQKQHDYWCGSTTWDDGDFYQSPECVRRERDRLLERVKRLEQAGDVMEKYIQDVTKTQFILCAIKWREAKEAKL